MKKILLLLSITFISFSSNSQDLKNVKNSYLEYFKFPRETVFLHTNKTTYIKGEEMWFKIYAYDRKNNLSSKTTSNIYLGIYDENGKQLDKKIFLAKDGVANGNIAIDSSFTSGNYYLKTYTNWMKNFKESDAFIQKIKIIDPETEEKISKKINSKEYDIQFLPEGGYLLNNIKNSVGIKAINDKGKGTVASGIIINSNGNEVASFKSNIFGIGKFTFTPISGETYSARIKLSNYKELIEKLPVAENVGVAMTVNNLHKEKVIINLSLNNKSLKLFKDKEYKIFIHKDGKAQIIPCTIDKKEKRIVIDKKGLYKGVNIITVFNEERKPILERMFFNSSNMNNKEIVLSKKQVQGDSIIYQLTSELLEKESLNASISVLPKETISYKQEHSIISAFYLKPYLKGTIENPQYYFTNTDRKKEYELDLLLLTQGWSAYNWDNIINFPPKPNFKYENGISIHGFVNNNMNKVNSLFLYPTELNSAKFIPTDTNGKFELIDFYPVIGENIKFSYINKRNKTRKPGIALSFLKYMQKDSINVDSYEKFISYYTNKNKALTTLIDNESEVLDEIVLKANLEKEKRKKYRLPFRGKLYNVDRAMAETYFNLSDFLNNNGFVVSDIGLNPTALGQTSIRHNSPRRGPVVFYLNGGQINDFNILANRPLDEFEDIYIDATPNVNMASVGGGVATFVVVVKLFTRRTNLFVNKPNSRINNTTVTYGFQPTKKFYTPKYFSYNTDTFKDYGIIHWEPSVNFKNLEAFNLTTINTGLKEIDFYIEGITSNGDLISQSIKIRN